MNASSLQELKDHYRKSGARTGIKLDDYEMQQAMSLLPLEGTIVATPPAELRYIEGLLRLPIGTVREFSAIPASGQSQCGCGRTTNALDIVAHAVNHRLHDESFLRDALIGVHNVFEFADEGRTAPCHQCGREFTARSYWTNAYMYA